MERAYRNLGYVLIALLPVFVAGFWIPYLSEFPSFDASITTAVHIHAVLLFSFLGLLIFQPFAIRRQAFSVHRVLGKIANVMMPFILVFSAVMLWKEFHEHLAGGASATVARNDEFLSTIQLVLLGFLYWASISAIRKRNVAAHMRYMICIALVLMPAGLARLFGYWFHFSLASSQTLCLALIDVILVTLIMFDRSRKANARPFALVLGAYIGIEVLWLLLGKPV